MSAASITPEQRAAMAPILPKLYAARAAAIAIGLDPATEIARIFDLPAEQAEIANRLLATNQL
jgi:hypothetical protein